MERGGFLITQMGFATGGEPGRVLEFDRRLNLVEEWPVRPQRADFNPHGISARPDLNLRVTSDFYAASQFAGHRPRSSGSARRDPRLESADVAWGILGNLSWTGRLIPWKIKTFLGALC